MNKRTKCLFVIATLLLLTNLSIVGCQVANENGEVKIRLNPKTADTIEKGGEAGVTIAEALTPFIGPAGGVATTVLVGLLTWFKKVKPKLTQAQTKAKMSHTVAGIVVESLETLKKEYPEIWAKYGEKIHKECLESDIDTKVLENFIRGLRGLPPKA